MRHTKRIAKIINDLDTTAIAAGVTITEDFTIPVNCVDMEAQIITSVRAGANDEHSVEYRTASALVLRVGSWDNIGSHYVSYPPPPEASIVRLTADNGSSVAVSFIFEINFFVEVDDDVTIVRSKVNIP